MITGAQFRDTRNRYNVGPRTPMCRRLIEGIKEARPNSWTIAAAGEISGEPHAGKSMKMIHENS